MAGNMENRVRVHVLNTLLQGHYRVVKTHMVPYLYSSFSKKEPYD